MQMFILQYNNWSKIYFSPLRDVPSDPEFNWLWWYEITYWRVDESQEVNRKAIDVIKSRLTEKIKEYDLVGKIIMTCNPDKWHIYNDFIKPQKEWTIKDNRVFIQSLYKDNPYIDHEKYEKSLETANKITKERLLYGNWEYDDTPWRLFDYDSILDLITNPRNNWTKYITCDVARMWKDKTIIRVWDWLEEIEKIQYDKNDLVMIQNKIKELCQRYWVQMSNVVVDEDWVWWWVVDNLRCKWFVNNSSPIDTRSYNQREIEKLPKPNYQNLKTQCYFELAKYINSWRIRLSELSDDLVQELDNIVQINIDKDRSLQLISKDDLKKKLWRSTDEADSLMMRMYFELKPEQWLNIYIFNK